MRQEAVQGHYQTFRAAGRAMQAEGSFKWMREMASIVELRRMFSGG
jgi:hypothetical protein